MGTLYIVATPIGNLEDITIRAVKVLLTAEVICAEDTRRSGQLLSLLKERYATDLHIEPAHRPQLISYYDEVEERKVPELITLLENGKSIALVSDAGTPLIADPGFRIVRECRKRQIPVVVVPGPSSLTAAVSVAGLPSNQILFLGYLPQGRAKKETLLRAARPEQPGILHPLIALLVPPHDLDATLKLLYTLFGPIEVTLARELTKTHEEVATITLSETIGNVDHYKGEIVLLFR